MRRRLVTCFVRVVASEPPTLFLLGRCSIPSELDAPLSLKDNAKLQQIFKTAKYFAKIIM